MRFGLNLGDAPADLTAPQQLDVYLRQVELAQRVGFRDFFVGHHYAYRSARWFQPFPLLARLSAELDADSRIGTGILVAPLLNPVALAEEAAVLAAMAPGRVVLGVGAGYRRLEYEMFGIPWESRVERLERAVLIMRQQWAGESSTVDGVEIPSGCPLDRALWPEIAMGAKSPGGVRRAGKLGAGLLAASKQPVARLEELAALHRTCWTGGGEAPPVIAMRNFAVGESRDDAGARLQAQTGARMSTYQSEGLQLGSSSPFGESDDLRETALLGTPDDLRRGINELEERVGVGSVLLRAQWPGMSRDDVADWLANAARAVISDAAPSSVPGSTGGSHA